jgi:hypothetical protein
VVGDPAENRRPARSSIPFRYLMSIFDFSRAFLRRDGETRLFPSLIIAASLANLSKNGWLIASASTLPVGFCLLTTVLEGVLVALWGAWGHF